MRLTCSDWACVPILIRSGKYLSADVAAVRIGFENCELIEVRVQPNPVLRLSSGAEARYAGQYAQIDPTETGPYARALIELLRGEWAWFLTDKEAGTIRAWLDAVEHLSERLLPPLPYDPGSVGPSRSDHPLLDGFS